MCTSDPPCAPSGSAREFDESGGDGSLSPLVVDQADLGHRSDPSSPTDKRYVGRAAISSSCRGPCAHDGWCTTATAAVAASRAPCIRRAHDDDSTHFGALSPGILSARGSSALRNRRIALRGVGHLDSKSARSVAGPTMDRSQSGADGSTGFSPSESRRSRLSSSMEEQWTFNPLVLGSSPRGGTELNTAK